MYSFEVKGGKKLKGEVDISGSKNASLPILATAILNEKPVTFTNVPNIEDVNTTLKILNYLGCKVTRNCGKITISSKNINKYEIPKSLMQKCRSTVILVGALIARFHKAVFYFPGGCNIGKRPIDLHMKAFEKLGINIVESDSKIVCKANRINGAEIRFSFPSVGATENAILASVFANGKTTIFNAAKEPEIIDLVNCLNKMGAKIRGAGTSKITIFGVRKFRSIVYRIMPDRIEAGTFLCVSAITRNSLTINNARPRDIKSILLALKKIGCELTIKGNSIYIKPNKVQNGIDLKTLPYPGFPTDIGPIFVSLLAMANGKSTIEETIFENRFAYVEELRKMGANIRVENRTIFIEGPCKLKGKILISKDLRGGATLVIASLSAKGKSTIENADYILRGYENFEKKLNKIGGDVKLINC